MMNLSKTRLAAIVGATLVAGGVMGGVAMAYQSHMFAARNALYAARSQLQVSRMNKGGHRVAALQAVDAAIRQVDIGIRVGR
ncbi:MAG: hypothetical protein B7Z58_01715 [Acidiphilium sp. 37-64-53]|uniref:hypothetical protein n=2 Tax=Acidocellaceae TaxID=3385905 RepID=UPI000BD7DF05|nr:hypothetical protein [Acidiphilium sp.]MBW4035039.1 hypothetical protein [Pseudomonadota bacterium]OYW03913.1 MAG: hypothetical protein B7Z58_01715 [Acidiphilium sp. 37-64-53]OZB23284.1 MAG: hypothetical protein B7X49_16225 [Acidiphilium sp. 34-64-41]HQT83844.1 hypothetical protein [Acidiphilium rubrum]